MLLNHKIYGQNNTKTVVILHGLFGMLDNWQRVAKYLSANYKVVSMDLRNHGKSAHSSKMTYPLLALDVIETLDEISISSAIIMGHSMGGKVAMQLAELSPETCDKLIFVDITSKKYKAGHLKYFDFFRSIDLSKYHSRKDIETEFNKWEKNQSIILFLLKNVQRNDGGGYCLKMNIAAIEEFYTTLIGEIELWVEFEKPVLLIKGGISRYVNNEDVLRMKATYPSLKLQTIDNAGHWVHADQFDEFCEVVSEFL